ncbi:MAG: hypothetical protein ACE366_12930 [Bradymonadia bacterium]
MRLGRTKLIGAAALSLLMVTGCGKKPEEGGKKTAEGAKKASVETPKKAKTPKLKTLEVPASVMAYGGTSGGLAEFLNGAGAMLQAVTGQALPAEEQAVSQLQAELYLTSPKGLDGKGTMRVAVFDNTKFPKAPVAAVLPISDQKAFVDSLPKKYLKEKDEGNAYSYLKYEGAKPPVYINFIGKSVVVTRHPGQFGEFKSFFESLSTAALLKGGSLVVRLDHIAAVHKDAIAAFFTEMRAEMTSNLKQMQNPAAEAMVEGIVDFMESAVRDLSALHVNLDIGAEGAGLKMVFAPKLEAELSRTFRGLEGKPVQLVGKFPPESPFFTSMTLPMETLSKFATSIMSAVAADPEQGKALAASMDEVMKLLGNEMMIAAHPDPSGTGLALSAMMRMQQGQGSKFPGLMSKLYNDPVYVASNEKLGVKVEYTAEAYEVSGVKVATSKTVMKDLPPEAMAMMGMMESFTEQHFAIKDDLMYVGYGPGSKPVLEALLGGQMAGGLDKAKGPARALKTAAPNAFMIMYVNPVEVAKRLALGGMNPYVSLLKDIQAETGLTISMGAEGGQLQFRIDVPTELAQKAFAAVQKGMGAF